MSKATPEKSAPLKQQSIAEIKKQIAAKKDGELVKLPSGLVFKLKKPSISRLLATDSLPSSLTSIAIKMDSNTNQPTTREEYLKSLQVIETIVQHAAVAPKVVADEADVDEDSIHIGDVDDQDKVAIYLYVQTGAQPLDSFRN